MIEWTDTFETLQLRSSIVQLVDEFSRRYFEWSKREVIGKDWSIFKVKYEFNSYYVYDLEDIYTAIYYKIPLEIVLRYYEEKNEKINLKIFYIKPVETLKTISGALPSGEAYAAIYGADFYFKKRFFPENK